MENNVFLDTSFAIALSVESDAHHKKAVTLSEKLENEEIKLITTTAILLEIGNALAKKRYRQAAVSLLDSLERDRTVEIVQIDRELYHQAFDLFRNRLDKTWGLIDCISFAVMKERSISEALTTDEHFVQAGFQCFK